MSISFYYILPQSDDECAICFESLEKNAMVHDGRGGMKHPFHEECIKKWAKIRLECPCCRATINPHTLFLKNKNNLCQLITQIFSRLFKMS